jgi:hypothetical protein
MTKRKLLIFLNEENPPVKSGGFFMHKKEEAEASPI